MQEMMREMGVSFGMVGETALIVMFSCESPDIVKSGRSPSVIIE